MSRIKDILPHRKEVCLLIKNAFSSVFCDELVQAHKDDFKPANLNYPTSYRNNERQVKNDSTFSELLFEQIRQYIPNKITVDGISAVEEGIWELRCLNEKIRICRYGEGQYFNKHLDGVHYRSEWIQSKLTFMIYLNGGNQEFKGGRTLFFASKEDDEVIGHYTPSKGDLIIFDHNLWHSGEEVKEGEKYILRSDILYEKERSGGLHHTRAFQDGHLGYIWKIISDSWHYYTAGRDRLIRIWDKNGHEVGMLEGHESSILDMLSFSKETLVSCSRDKTIRIWSKQSNKSFEEMHRLVVHESTVLGLLKLNSQEFISCGADGKLNLFNINGDLLDMCKAHDEWIWSMELISDDLIATVGEDGILKFWKLKPFKSIGELSIGYPLTSIVYDKHNNILYTGGLNGNLVAFKIEDGVRLHKLFEKECHRGKIWVIKCNENYVFSGGEDNKVMVWKQEGMEKVKEYIHKNFVQDLILEGESIVSVSYDGEIRVLEVLYEFT